MHGLREGNGSSLLRLEVPVALHTQAGFLGVLAEQPLDLGIPCRSIHAFSENGRLELVRNASVHDRAVPGQQVSYLPI